MPQASSRLSDVQLLAAGRIRIAGGVEGTDTVNGCNGGGASGEHTVLVVLLFLLVSQEAPNPITVCAT